MRFSIIIPVYNVQKYIAECIESILKQTYTDYEILLIDDGSTDSSGDLCDSYKKNNSNIYVFHKENGGLSDARNYGISKARGEYLIFIDSDDYIGDSDFLKKANACIVKADPDLIVYGRKKYFESVNKFEEKTILIHNEKLLIEEMITQNFYKATAWDKIIKREIVVENKMLFPIGRIGEDIKWCSEILKNINLDKIGILNEPIYVYRQRSGSICTNIKEKDLFDIFEMIQNEIEENNNEKSYIINSYLAYEYIVRLGRVYSKTLNTDNKELKEQAHKLKNLFDYDLSNKVKKVRLIYKVLGYKNTAKILGLLIDKKNKKRG